MKASAALSEQFSWERDTFEHGNLSLGWNVKKWIWKYVHIMQGEERLYLRYISNNVQCEINTGCYNKLHLYFCWVIETPQIPINPISLTSRHTPLTCRRMIFHKTHIRSQLHDFPHQTFSLSCCDLLLNALILSCIWVLIDIKVKLSQVIKRFRQTTFKFISGGSCYLLINYVGYRNWVEFKPYSQNYKFKCVC